jgi:hypothetical protein
MNKLKVVKVDSNEITFDNGVTLSSYHSQDCCESHSLTLSDLKVDDFEGLEFDLTNDKFFNRIPDFGIELIPIKGHSVKIPAHGYNNGYYGTNLDLVITNGKDVKTYDITECQEITD